MSQEHQVLSELEAVIRKAIAFAFTSKSCHESIATGSGYQAITLGGNQMPGFRGGRSEFFECVDFSGKTVLDIGSNYGELSRHALRQGAAHVHGVEYEPLFAVIADLVSIHERVDTQKYTFERADVTKDFKFDRRYDVVLAFSVYTYISKRLAEIAAANSETLLLETHSIDARWEAQYVAPLLKHYPTILLIGSSDWGTARALADGKRFVLACVKSPQHAWNLIARLQQRRPKLSSAVDVDLESAEIPAFGQLRQYLRQSALEAVDAFALDKTVAQSLGRSEPGNLSDLAYWLEFYRGYKRFKAANGVEDDNPYLRALSRMLAVGHQFDAGVQAQLKDGVALRARVKARLENFDAIATGDASKWSAATLFDVDGESAGIRVQGAPSDISCGSRIDGYHRLGAALLSHKTGYPIYTLRTFGQI